MSKDRDPLAAESAAESRILHDDVLGRWVVVAPGRSRRPRALTHTDSNADGGPDPFLEGNEHLTPPETFAIRPDGSPPDGPGWLVRSVPNRYPVVGPNGDGPDHRGQHEVIVESPHFETSLAELPVEQIRHVLATYRQRLGDVRKTWGTGYGLVFKNSGPEAGATVEHTHSQLIVSRLIPPTIVDQIAAAKAHHAAHGGDPHGAELDRERAAGARMLFETDDWAAFCPKAARFPLECRLVPRTAWSRPEGTPDTAIDDLAGALRRLLRALETARPGAAYNMVLHTLPFQEPDDVPWFRWWLELIPRLARFGGFELGGGTFINPVAPATAAEWLRDALDRSAVPPRGSR